MTEPTVHKVTLWMCSLCLDGAGGMCHSPGCALCRNRGPDMPLRDSCMVESIDGVGFDYDTLKRKTMPAQYIQELTAEQATLALLEGRAPFAQDRHGDWWRIKGGFLQFGGCKGVTSFYRWNATSNARALLEEYAPYRMGTPSTSIVDLEDDLPAPPEVPHG